MNNTIISNRNYGVAADAGTQDNAIFLNRLYYNNGGTNQAEDNGTRNDWSSSDEGNYWSEWTTPDSNMDGIVDIPYDINGTAYVKDFFPLTNPNRIPVPTADAGYDIIVEQHEEVIFSGSESTNPSYITNYTWSFLYNGHKRYLYGLDPHFIFDIVGVYKVSLHVKNTFNQGSSDMITVSVKDITPPSAYAGEDVFINQHDTFSFDGTNSFDNVGNTIYKWNFIYDGIFRTLVGTSPVFTFHLAGEYPVTLEVADAEGNWATDIMNINVRDITKPVAYAGENQTIKQHDTILLNGALSSDNIAIINYTWAIIHANFNHTLFGKTTFFTFNDIGHYSIRLTVFDEFGNRDVDIINITVLDETPPHAEAGEDVFMDEGGILDFDGSGSWDNVEITEYRWEFSYDGTQVEIYGPKVSFEFGKGGNYIVTLHVIDEGGNEAMDRLLVTVSEMRYNYKSDTDGEHSNLPDQDANKINRLHLYYTLGIVVWAFLVISTAVLIYKHNRRQKVNETIVDGGGGEKQ